MKKRPSFVSAGDATTICQWLATEGVLEDQGAKRSHPERKAVASYLNQFADSVAQGYQIMLREVGRLPNGSTQRDGLMIPEALLHRLNNREFVGEELAQEGTVQGLFHFSGDQMALMFEVSSGLLAAKKCDEAANAFMYLIYLNPFVAQFWQQLGRCWIGLQHLQEALYAFCAAINCDPYNPSLYRSAVNACLDWHHFETAVSLLSYGLHRVKGSNLPDVSAREERFKDMMAYVIRHHQKHGGR